MEKEIVFQNENVTVLSNDDFYHIDELVEQIKYATQYTDFTFDGAPEGTMAWAMDEDGNARWYDSDKLEINNRFGDWQKWQPRGEIGSLGPAPSFGFDEEFWKNSLRKRTDPKLKIKIEITRE